MGNTVVINAVEISDYALDPILGGKSSFESVLEYAASLPDVSKILCLGVEEKFPLAVAEQHTAEYVLHGSWSIRDVLTEMKNKLEGSDIIFYVYGDTPLLDKKLSEKMLEDHKRYFAQYSFADGYPYGLTPEIISFQLIPALLQLEGDENRPVERSSIFSVVQKDINAFEIETALSPKDMRLLRITLAADTKRNALQLKSVIEKGGVDAESVRHVVESNPDILRTLPAYVNIQVAKGCPQSCSYCPYPQMEENLLHADEYMDVDAFQSIVEKVAAYCDDAVIGLSLFGEPSLHPRCGDLIEAVLERPALGLVIETSGIGWDPSVLRQLGEKAAAAEGELDRYTWIVSLDSLDRNVYNSLRGDGYYKAMETARLLMELFPERVWVQAVRMKENEEALETFYRQWKKETDKVIIQKYDTYCGFLPERKVADLSPVIRFPCWHIKRDLSIRIDGTVPLCREDINCSRVLGNIFNENIQTIWERGGEVYREHTEAAYNDLCEGCDEYYTYNF